MFGIGVPELIVIAVVAFLLMGGRLARGGGSGVRISGPTLVLRRFRIDEAGSTKALVDIAGRASGITAWLLTVMGFDAETSLKVTDEEVSFRSSSLFGQAHHLVALPSVSSTHCGYSKPIGYLIVGAIIVIGSLFAAFDQPRGGPGAGPVLLLGLIVGGVMLITYYLSKKIVISLETNGGMVMGLSFKRSVIENVSVDIAEALRAILLVNQKVIEAQCGRLGAARNKVA